MVIPLENLKSYCINCHKFITLIILASGIVYEVCIDINDVLITPIVWLQKKSLKGPIIIEIQMLCSWKQGYQIQKTNKVKFLILDTIGSFPLL